MYNAARLMPSTAVLERVFRFRERGTDLPSEVRAGLTTMARRVRGALLIGILGTTVLAIVLNGAVAGWKGFPTPGAATLPTAIVQWPDFSTFGRLDLGVIAGLGVVTAVLVTFSIMLSDFFDTMGTVIAVGGKAGFLDAQGRLPGASRVLLVDSLGAALGGFANRARPGWPRAAGPGSPR
jgi:AGZA family xanthine/uracil permease-like MFS transporter